MEVIDTIAAGSIMLNGILIIFILDLRKAKRHFERKSEAYEKYLDEVMDNREKFDDNDRVE